MDLWKKGKDRVYDFAFVYEIKNREQDSLLLLKSEMEYRGYSVKMIEDWEQAIHRDVPPFAKTVVSFALHSKETMDFISQFVRGADRFVNLQWEQVYTNGDRAQKAEEGGTTGVFDEAKKAMHICWGENTREDLTQKYGLKESHAAVTGCISLDFLREEFRPFYLSKEALQKKFGIDKYKTMYLMISSFSYGQLPETVINSELYQNQGFDVRAQVRIEVESQRIILDWLEEEVIRHPDILMVYRPHPAESNIKRLAELAEKYDNFRVIPDLSIRQWILTADRMFTWWSTSVAEIYAAGKGCSILRPVELPHENDLEIYEGARFVTTFEEFDRNYLGRDTFPISDEVMQKYYAIDKDIPAFMKIADVLERVLHDDEFKVEGYENLRATPVVTAAANAKWNLKQFVFDHEPLCKIAEKIAGDRIISPRGDLAALKKEFAYFREMAEKNHQDYDEMKNRLITLTRLSDPFRTRRTKEEPAEREETEGEIR